MTHTSDIVRPPKALVDALAEIGSATASAELNRMGIRDAHLRGVTSRIPGKALAGPALTLQFMPIREDQYSQTEYADPEKQLHRHVLYHAQAGDFVVVDARGEMAASGMARHDHGARDHDGCGADGLRHLVRHLGYAGIWCQRVRWHGTGPALAQSPRRQMRPSFPPKSQPITPVNKDEQPFGLALGIEKIKPLAGFGSIGLIQNRPRA